MDSDILLLKNKINNSYCKYSKFRVACLVKLSNNNKYIGVNVENVSYSLTLCAEMTAISQAITNGAKKGDINYIIIYSDTIDEIMPCGSCRQIIAEFANEKTDIFCIGKNEIIKKFKINEILPSKFKF